MTKRLILVATCLLAGAPGSAEEMLKITAPEGSLSGEEEELVEVYNATSEPLYLEPTFGKPFAYCDRLDDEGEWQQIGRDGVLEEFTELWRSRVIPIEPGHSMSIETACWEECAIYREWLRIRGEEDRRCEAIPDG
jgi:hypothetical protein